MVLLHGLGRSLEDWSETVDALAARYRVIAPDLVGFGYTDKPRGPYTLAGLAHFVGDLLDALSETRPVTLVGNSLGGAVAQTFAAARPERARRLVLVASAGVRARGYPRPAPRDGARSRRALDEARAARSAENTVRSLFFDPALATEARIDQALELAQQPGAARAFLSLTRALGTPFGVRAAWRARLSRRLAAQKLPTLILWGENDLILPAAHLPEGRQALPARTHAPVSRDGPPAAARAL